MDLSKRWTVFACDAEYDAFGMSRIVNEHNALVDRLKAELSRREAEAGDVVVEGYFPDVLDGRPIIPSDLTFFSDDKDDDEDSIPVTVTIRRRSEPRQEGEKP